jgi:hypothetical protein
LRTCFHACAGIAHVTRHPSPADVLYRIFTDVLYKRGGVFVHLSLECVEFLFPHNVFPLV